MGRRDWPPRLSPLLSEPGRPPVVGAWSNHVPACWVWTVIRAARVWPRLGHLGQTPVGTARTGRLRARLYSGGVRFLQFPMQVIDVDSETPYTLIVRASRSVGRTLREPGIADHQRMQGVSSGGPAVWSGRGTTGGSCPGCGSQVATSGAEFQTAPELACRGCRARRAGDRAERSERDGRRRRGDAAE